MDVCTDQQTISQDWPTEDVFINQQEISRDWPTEDVYIDQQEISEEWPTKESFKRREISKWRDISDVRTWSHPLSQSVSSISMLYIP